LYEFAGVEIRERIIFGSGMEEDTEELKKIWFERECAKLDMAEEQALADLGLPLDLEDWPEYQLAEMITN
jgi:hypothetical protein